MDLLSSDILRSKEKSALHITEIKINKRYWSTTSTHSSWGV